MYRWLVLNGGVARRMLMSAGFGFAISVTLAVSPAWGGAGVANGAHGAQSSSPSGVVDASNVNAEQQSLPSGFAYASNEVEGLVEEIRYFGDDNFVGKRVDGYLAPRCVLSVPAAEALRMVQERAVAFGLGVKVFDCYRPSKAVAHFVRWAKDLSDTRRKADYYPDVDKSRLFEEGYIAEQSGHSRGSTVDLTLVDSTTGAEIDMGTGFDLFGPSSWPVAPNMSTQQRANRMLLHSIMVSAGFTPYPQEWWHFTLANEPYPDTYFEFDVR